MPAPCQLCRHAPAAPLDGRVADQRAHLRADHAVRPRAHIKHLGFAFRQAALLDERLTLGGCVSIKKILPAHLITRPSSARRRS